MGKKYTVSTQLYLKNGDKDVRLGEISDVEIERSFMQMYPTINLKGILDAPTEDLKEFKKIFINMHQKIEMPKKYIINKGATVLIWDNGEKTIVKRCEDDEFNKRLGFLTAFFQHYCGMSKNKANKFLAELEVEDEEIKTTKPKHMKGEK